MVKLENRQRAFDAFMWPYVHLVVVDVLTLVFKRIETSRTMRASLKIVSEDLSKNE